MHAHVILRAPDGRDHELVHGDVVGRVWSAALQLDDGRISEAHALVSLREGELQLLPLRGTLAVDGERRSQVPLRPGVVVALAPGVLLEVTEVHLPDRVLGVEGTGLARQLLPGVCSLFADPTPRVAKGWRDGAAFHVWTTGDRWMIRAPDGQARPVLAGETVAVGGMRVAFVEVPLRDAGPRTTRRAGDLDAPLRLVASFDTVHVFREDTLAIGFGGMQARMISELVALGGPVSWSTLTEEIWPDEPDSLLRRGRLDTLLSRIRRRLRAAGLRADLVRTDGSGTVELFLYPQDVVEDRT